ncbi:ABC transporter permease [Terrarubrum flagellatum]|uniref:ABC transporter permease n=1 Tax=Terrirubrum flagellatum TaxID=2895980 RepID=UPI003144FE6A
MSVSRPALRYGVLFVVIVAVWQGLHWIGGDSAVTSPIETANFTRKLLATEQFWEGASETFKAFSLALLIAIALGLTIGVWLGFHRLSGEVLTPLLMGVASVPKVTLYPIVLLLFGLGLSAKVAFGALHGIMPIALFTIGAVANIKPVFVKVGRAGKLKPLQMARHILLPAALPEIFSGLRIGFSLTLIGTILAEMFASQRGLGFMLMTAIGLHNVALITSLALILTIFAGGVSIFLLSIDRRLRGRL